MVIRKLVLKDIAEYKRIKLESLQKEPLAFDTSFEEAIEWTKEKWEEQMKEFTNPSESIFYLAEEDEKMIAFAYMLFNSRKKKSHVMEFPTMYVNENFRSKGIASKLLTTILDDVKEKHKNIIKIQISVYESQLNAIGLYEKFGFKVYGEFEKEMVVDGKFYKQLAMELFLQ